MKTKFHVIVGLGKTGLSCARFCLREKISFAVTDSRMNPPGKLELQEIAPEIEMMLGHFSKKLIDQADQLIISPGVSLKEPVIAEAVAKGIPCVGDIELFVQCVSSPIVAITGSNAKSTVTTLVGEMAKQSGINVCVAGNIGTPVLDLLTKRKADLYVLELSSFQLETTPSLRAKVATILNVSEDHMDRYDSMAEYIAAKKNIYYGCEIAVVNRADSRIWPDQPVEQMGFSLNIPAQHDFGLRKIGQQEFLAQGEQTLLDISEIKLQGKHNVENALAALAIGEALGLPQKVLLQTLKTFAGLPHRCQLVRERQGVKWYNDSKGTNVGATAAALEGLGHIDAKNIILIAGGQGKNADFSLLIEPVKKYVRQVLLMGEDAKKIENVLNIATHCEYFKTFKEVIEHANKISRAGDIVLLSPACASFDMFDNYEHRGREFEKLVQNL